MRCWSKCWFFLANMFFLMLVVKMSERWKWQVCVPDPKLLVRKRLLVNLATKSSEKSRHELPSCWCWCWCWCKWCWQQWSQTAAAVPRRRRGNNDNATPLRSLEPSHRPLWGLGHPGTQANMITILERVCTLQNVKIVDSSAWWYEGWRVPIGSKRKKCWFIICPNAGHHHREDWRDWCHMRHFDPRHIRHHCREDWAPCPLWGDPCRTKMVAYFIWFFIVRKRLGCTQPRWPDMESPSSCSSFTFSQFRFYVIVIYVQ